MMATLPPAAAAWTSDGSVLASLERPAPPIRDWNVEASPDLAALVNARDFSSGERSFFGSSGAEVDLGSDSPVAVFTVSAFVWSATSGVASAGASEVSSFSSLISFAGAVVSSWPVFPRSAGTAGSFISTLAALSDCLSSAASLCVSPDGVGFGATPSHADSPSDFASPPDGAATVASAATSVTPASESILPPRDAWNDRRRLSASPRSTVPAGDAAVSGNANDETPRTCAAAGVLTGVPPCPPKNRFCISSKSSL